MKRFALLFVFLTVLTYQSHIFAQEDFDRRMMVVMEEQITPEIYIDSNRLTLKNAPVGKTVEIFSIIGTKIREIKITTPDMNEELNLRRGIYIFKMGEIVKKGVVR